MKVESRLLIGLGAFFGVIGLVYWFWPGKVPGYHEDAGFMLLIGTMFLGFLPGAYYLYWHRRFEGYKHFGGKRLDHAVGPRPEDRSDASIEEGAGTIESFPSTSIWPFCLGAGAFLLVNGLVFGWWIAMPGVGLVLTALVGVTAESRRGGNV